MKKFLRLSIVFLFMFSIAQTCFAEEYKLLVLPDNLQFESTNYYIYPDASTIFASDTINTLKKAGKITPVSMVQVRDAFRKNERLRVLAKNTLKEFKYNYNVNFVDLRKITHSFDTDKILIITSTTDVQSHFLRRTIFDLLNVPGCAVVDPAYRISTYIALVDVDKEEVLWQHTYQKVISEKENRMVAVNYAPATVQLEDIKFYSENWISLIVANEVQSKILPPPAAAKQDEGIVPINSFKAKNQKGVKSPVPLIQPLQTKDESEILTKPFVPTKPRTKYNDVMINDI